MSCPVVRLTAGRPTSRAPRRQRRDSEEGRTTRGAAAAVAGANDDDGPSFKYSTSRVCFSRRRLRSRAATAATIACAASAVPTSSSSAAAPETRGGGTPGSWNLGVAHSSASGTDQRSYTNRLFKVYAALMAAAQHGDVDALEDLMDTAYVPAPDASTAKIRDAQVRAAALKAAEAGQAEALSFLIDRGADLGLRERDACDFIADETCDDAENGQRRRGDDGGDDGGDDVALSTNANTTTTLAIEAAARGHAEVMEVLFRRCGVSPDARDAGRAGCPTAVMEAAARGHVQCVTRCVTAGADLDATTRDAQLCTAAMLAAANGHAACLNVLRAAGADVDAERGGDGKTAMQLHREKVAEDMAKFKASSSS